MDVLVFVPKWSATLTKIYIFRSNSVSSTLGILHVLWHSFKHHLILLSTTRHWYLIHNVGVAWRRPRWFVTHFPAKVPCYTIHAVLSSNLFPRMWQLVHTEYDVSIAVTFGPLGLLLFFFLKHSATEKPLTFQNSAVRVHILHTVEPRRTELFTGSR